MGVGNDDEMREVLVVRDIATRAIAAIPTMSRNTDDVVDALKRLIGRRKVKLAYSDVAPEFDAAMTQLRIPIDSSFLTRIAEEQFVGGTDEPRNDQNRCYISPTCRTTSTVLALCTKLCNS